jgi:predicted outer membrane lipoprotein
MNIVAGILIVLAFAFLVALAVELYNTDEDFKDE